MRSAESVFAACCGALLVGTGIYAAIAGAVEPPWGYIAGITLVLFGGNAIFAALAARRPWIFLIGPLP